MTKESKPHYDFPVFIAKAGPDKGREIGIHEGEIVLGRSSDADITLVDPILSRKHCRVSYGDGKITIEDLASSNGTIVNGKEVTRAELHDGDIIEIGDTKLLLALPEKKPAEEIEQPLISIGPADDVPQKPAESESDSKAENGDKAVVVDLGFESSKQDLQETKQPNWRPLIWGLGAVAVLALAVSLIMRTPEETVSPVLQAPKEPALTPLEIEYEKVEANTEGVFRYSMHLNADGLLSVEIDDMNEDRHVRKETPLASNKVERLAKELDKSGFFHLSDKYEGVAPQGVLGSWDITVITDKRVKRVAVYNRVEPEVFRDVRETLETFGKNELGIWAIQFSRDKLVELADEALTRARNLYDERGIDYGNTYKSIQRFKEASFYLDTVDPKPDFFADIVSGLSTAEEELGRKYEEQRFLADRAINLKDWASAARELRILREMIPDREDERYIEAGRKLLDVENRLKTSKDK